PLRPRGALMASITFEHLTKKFDDTTAVDDLTIEVMDGEFLVLVGPSGCGKTTALRMLAGLEEITAGRIKIGERVVNNLEPGARRDPEAAKAARHDHHLRHARPGRGDDDGRPDRGHAARCSPADRNALGALRLTREHVRRELHGLSCDESRARGARRSRRPG